MTVPAPRTDIPIALPDGTTLLGSSPLVLLGPNGAGKSRLGASLVSQKGYERIPALRSLTFPSSLPYQRQDVAKRDADQQIQRSSSSTFQQSEELPLILSELKAEDAQSAVAFRTQWENDSVGAKPTITRLAKLVKLWKLTFPNRELDLSTYNPKVTSSLPGRPADPYSANQMSDGERGALYLCARILRANPGVLIVDEPEVHFHALLARSFWDAIEAERSDCRFIYITHDIPFALSRKSARIGIVRNEITVDLVSENAPIPPALFESILGAASLSIVARRIIFCEGIHGRSVDPHFYGAWFKAPESVVIPVGGCEDVEQSVKVFRENPAIANGKAIGIIDRDYWPDSHLESLTRKGLHVLPVHEVEALLSLPTIASAICNHLSKSEAETASILSEFKTALPRLFSGISLNKIILERTKRQLELSIRGLTNQAKPDTDLDKVRHVIVHALSGGSLPDAGSMFDEQTKDVQKSLAGDVNTALRIVPGKDCLSLLCGKIGISEENYIRFVTDALSQPEKGGDPKLARLNKELVVALTPFLPPRQ